MDCGARAPVALPGTARTSRQTSLPARWAYGACRARPPAGSALRYCWAIPAAWASPVPSRGHRRLPCAAAVVSGAVTAAAVRRPHRLLTAGDCAARSRAWHHRCSSALRLLWPAAATGMCRPGWSGGSAPCPLRCPPHAALPSLRSRPIPPLYSRYHPPTPLMDPGRASWTADVASSLGGSHRCAAAGWAQM